MGTPNSSAGVYVTETDNSQYAAAAATSIAVVVGESAVGPVGQRTLITSKKDFISQFGLPDARIGFMHYTALAFLNEGTRMYVTRVAPGSKYSGLTVGYNGSVNTITPWAAGIVDPTTYSFAANDLFTIYANNQGVWANNVAVKIVPNTNAPDNTFFVEVYVGTSNAPAERHQVSLRWYQDGYGVQRNIQEYINRNSNLIYVLQNINQSAFVAAANAPLVNTQLPSTNMAGGINGTAATASDFINAWNLYQDVDTVDVNMLLNGGLTDPDVQLAMEQVARLRSDCIAILDLPQDQQNVQDAVDYRHNILMLDSSYAAVYAPDVLVKDMYNDITLFLPVSGFVGAAYAATDRDYQVWFAPAGMNRGSLPVKGSRYVYNQGDRDTLVDNQINPIRTIVGSGVKIWGADTMQTMNSALSNINVRRLMMFLEKSLSKAALYSVFEPNDPILWGRLTEICTRFLRPIKQGRGLYWYTVVCDESNNPAESIAAGDVNLNIVVDPVLPAKRIFLNAIVNKTGATVTLSYTNPNA